MLRPWLQASSMAEGKYPTAFPLKHAQKDVRLALAAAKAEGLSLPVASAANGQYIKASYPAVCLPLSGKSADGMKFGLLRIKDKAGDCSMPGQYGCASAEGNLCGKPM